LSHKIKHISSSLFTKTLFMRQSYLKMLGLLAVGFCGSFFVTAEVKAQTAPLVQYNFTGAAGSEDSLAADAQPANGRFYFARRGSALTGTAGGGYLTSNNWPTTFNANAYHSVSGRPDANFNLNLTAIALTVRHSGSGPGTFEIRSSLDNYTSVLKTITVPSATVADVRDSLVLGAAFSGLTSKVEFRVFGYNATATTGTGRLDKVKLYGTIQSATPAGPTVNFASATSSVAENVTGGTLNIPVTISNPSATTPTSVTVAVATSAGTATSGTDYTITTGTLTFAAGSSTNQNAVLTITDDILAEGNETINLILSNASTGAIIGTNNTHTVTITDNEVTPTIAFGTPATVSVAENVTGGTVSIPVTISAATTTPITVLVALATPAGTATATSDFVFAPQTLTFTPGGALTQNASLTIVNDRLIEANETVLLTLQNAVGGTISTTNNNYTVTIVSEDQIPTYTVAQIHGQNPTTFVADSIGVKVKIIGVLHGVNQRSTTQGGILLSLIDNTGAIGIFSSSNSFLPTTIPVEGDRVRAIGTISQFNGLTQITLDSIKVLASNQTLTAPVVVNGPLTEAVESKLVTIANPVHLVTPSQWSTTGTAAFNVDVTDGTNTYQVRIFPTTNIFGTAAPTGQFVLTGTVSQFDSSNPFDSGYQIIPRRLTDLRNVTGVSENLSAAIAIYPNPVSDKLFLNLSALAAKNATVSVMNSLGQVVANVPDNASEVNVASFPAGIYTLRVVTEKGIAAKRFVKIN
jgi:DNA/RNA endonuclease YhcR with UshA esterase domain